MRGSSAFVAAAVVLSSGLARADGDVHPKAVVRHHSAAPWITFGAGWAFVVGGAITEFFSQLVMTGDSCATCPPSPPTDSARAGQIAGWIGLGTGAAMVVGGLVWHFAEPAGPVITVAPTVSRDLSGLMLRATF